jgi:predicted MFS family arabinose efflux permease
MREQLRVVLAVARDPVLARIELAYFGFNMAEYATWMAILVYAYGLGGAGEAALFAVIQLVPSGVVAPFAALAGDRFRRDRVLLAGYLLQALSLIAAAVSIYVRAPVEVVLLVATVAAIAFTITRPVQAVILPSITNAPRDLTAANAVSGLAENVAIFVGPLIGGLLLIGNEPAHVFTVFAVVTLVGALLVARLHIDDGATRTLPTGPRAIMNEAFGGFSVLRRERRVLLLILVLSSTTVLVGALDLLLVAAAIDLLHAGPSWAGYLGSAFGFGGIIGALATVTLVGRRRLTPALAASGGLCGAPIVAFGVLPFIALAPVLLAVSGAGRSISTMAGQTLVQRTAPEALLTRVFGVAEGVSMFALAIGAVASGVLVATFGVVPALLVTGLLVPVVVLASWFKLRDLDRHARAPDPEALALLRRLPIFSPLAATSMEHILGELIRLDVPAGHVIIRQGDRGDRFYVVAEGHARVTREGLAIAEPGPGEYFGEIALLRDVPRTATITALTPMRLIAIERDRFLEAVTGHSQSREHALAVAAERTQRDRLA